MKLGKYYLIALAVILIDQTVKLLTHFNMELGPIGEIQLVGDVIKLHYTLNEGMAFGISFAHEYSKLILTVFRLIAGAGIAFYLYRLYIKNSPKGLLICVSLILGGAVGNVIDCVFYGIFLDNAPYGSPMNIFYGQVIDTFYFDIYEGVLPDWLGGGWISLWPIFNIADASIFTAVAILLIWQKSFFDTQKNEKETTSASS